MSLGSNSCSELNKACQRPIRIIFTDSPPLIFTDESGNVKGVLKGENLFFIFRY